MSNSEILNKIGTSREIWKAKEKRRVRMIGHNVRHSGIVHLCEKQW